MVFNFTGILRGIQASLPASVTGNAGISSPTGKPGFNRILTRSDFFTSNKTNLKNGQFNKLGTFTVPADEFYAWGYGSASFPDNQGFIYFDLKNPAGTQLEGLLRLAVTNPSETVTAVVKEFRTENIRGSQTDRTQQLLLPEQRPLAKEDSGLTMLFNPDTDDVEASTTTSTINIAVTRYIK